MPVVTPRTRLVEDPQGMGCALAVTWVLSMAVATGFGLTTGEVGFVGFFLFGWGVIPLGIGAWFLARRRLRNLLRENDFALCAACRHSLRGLPETGACPECGVGYDLVIVRPAWRRAAGLERSPRGFWARQFAGRRGTEQQVLFDVFAGVAMPVFCLLLDPFVLRSWGGGSGVLGSPFREMVYALIALEISLLVAWLIADGGFRSGPANRLAAGGFFLGATASLGLGLAILPFSLVGLLFLGLGVLGLTPWLTALVLLRAGVRAWRAARGVRPRPSKSSEIAQVAAGAALTAAAVAACGSLLAPPVSSTLLDFF